MIYYLCSYIEPGRREGGRREGGGRERGRGRERVRGGEGGKEGGRGGREGPSLRCNVKIMKLLLKKQGLF